MLPFSKPKGAGEEIELDDDDLVLVESPPAFASSSPTRADDRFATARPRRVTASVSRRIVDESIQQDVAGECLSAIAAASREGHSSSHVRSVVTRPPPARTAAPVAPPVPPVASPPASRLPSVSPPPFVRTTTARRGSARASEAPAPRESAPPPAFVRRSSPMIAVAGEASGASARSVAPVSFGDRTPEPTVIVVRERPKAAWVIGAAVIGALVAGAASRLVMTSAEDPPAAASRAPPAAIAPPPGVVVAPPPAVTVAVPPAVAAPAASVAIMRFGEDQGVAFKAPPRPAAPTAPIAPTSARPRAPAGGPGLADDASLTLGASPPSPPRASAPAPAPSPAPPPAETARKRALTPEQQLAEAQLKASMR
ncbi:MAG TPA: hypothetical protein VLT33_12950 [Labilithrix sp.]|nr:hypothetical protein [Labilithrix sp.]